MHKDKENNTISEKKYEVDKQHIFTINDSFYIIAETIEEAIFLFKDYLEKEKDSYKPSRIRKIEMNPNTTLSKK